MASERSLRDVVRVRVGVWGLCVGVSLYVICCVCVYECGERARECVCVRERERVCVCVSESVCEREYLWL